jgi:hypothetical protein
VLDILGWSLSNPCEFWWWAHLHYIRRSCHGFFKPITM